MAEKKTEQNCKGRNVTVDDELLQIVLMATHMVRNVEKKLNNYFT